MKPITLSQLIRSLPIVLLSLWLIWLIGVVLHGTGVHLWGRIKLDFFQAAQFGDAFGSLASLMATLAAAGAFLTLQQQRADSRANRVLGDRQSFEATLFHLFGVLSERSQGVTKSRTITAASGPKQIEVRGAEAFEAILIRCSNEARDADWDVGNSYSNVFDEEEANLGHYFRIVYHVILYVHREDTISLEKKYRYVRFLRAQLSNPELVLILLNCMFGPGKEKFLPLAIRYDLFQALRASSYPILEHLGRKIPTPPPEIQKIQEALQHSEASSPF